MIENIIFDFDGVIVESVDIKTVAFAELFKRENKNAVQKVVDYHLANTGVSRYEKFRYIYKNILKRDLSEKEFKKLCDNFAALVVTSVIRAPYVKGAYAFLKKNAARYKFFVVSATPQDEIEKIIRARGIASFFTAIYGAPTLKSDAVRDILKHWRLEGQGALYVGDALSDYKAAKHNRVNFVARIRKNENIFSGIGCPKIEDMTLLERAMRIFNKRM